MAGSISKVRLSGSARQIATLNESVSDLEPGLHQIRAEDKACLTSMEISA